MTTSTERNIRILLIDEQVIVRSALRLLLDTHPGFEVIGESANFVEAAALAKEPPDIILLDLKSFNHRAQIETFLTLFKSNGRARILLLTDGNDPEESLNAVRLGAMGLVHKNEPVNVLLKAIERIHAGEVWINRAMMARVIDGLWSPISPPTTKSDPEALKIASLTEREREVVSLVGEGLRNKQIAERLFISEITVRHHLTSIFNKLGVSVRLELALYSYRHGLAKPPV